MDDVAIMHRLQAQQRVFEYPLGGRDRQLLSNQVQEVVAEIPVDEDRSLWNKIFQWADVRTVDKVSVHALEVLEIVL